MKKLITLVFLLCSVAVLNAQENIDPESPVLSEDMSVRQFRRMKFQKLWNEYPKFEMRFGYSGFPIADIIGYEFTSRDNINGPYWNRPPGLEGMYAPYEGATYMTGNFSAEFSWHIKKWLTLSGGLYANGIFGSEIDPYDGSIVSRKAGASVTVLPVARFYWMNAAKCRLYSSAGIGLNVSGYDRTAYLIPAFQLTPIGITVGTKVFFYAEYSLGTVYLGGQAGIGFRF